jgi:predicted permease
MLFTSSNVWRAARRLGRQPGLTLAAIVAFAMGIGFTTTMFGIVRGGTRALPVEAPDEIVAVTETARGADIDVRPFTFRQWQLSLQSFAGFGAWRDESANVSGGGTPDRLNLAVVTPNTFVLLGVPPARGRPLVDADAALGAPQVALISDIVWRTRFAADPAAIGQSIRLDGIPHTIVGVMPPAFGFPLAARVWTPLRVEAGTAPGDGDALKVFGRLANGVTVDRAERELQIVTARLAAEHPSAFSDHGGRVFPFVEIETPPEIKRGLQLLVAAVSLAFLVACANVANLLLARAAARTRETALRSALGASRARLVRDVVLETLLLAGASCVLGLGISALGLDLFASASAGILEAYWVDFRIDAVVAGFAIGLALLAALAAGLLPALRATRAGVIGSLLHSHGRAVAGLAIGRLGRALVVAQIALACGLFILTATLVSASRSLRAVDLIFPARAILTTTLGVPPAVLQDPAARARLLAGLDSRLRATPGLGPTAFVSVLPGRGAGNWIVALADAATSQPRLTAGVAMVTPDFFDLAGAPAGRGRLLTWRDDHRAAPVAVVNDSFVRRFSPDRDVVGRSIRVGDREFAVVGVVRDLLMQDVEDRDGAGVYLSMLQARPFAIRTMSGPMSDPAAAIRTFRAAIGEVDADLPVLEPAPLYDAIYADKRVLDVMSTLFLAFGAGTVFLAVVGLFALLSFAVTARTREFGVRVALGASSRDLVALVLGRGARELGWGLGIGLLIAVALSRALAATMENFPAAGSGVFVAIVMIISTAAALAMWKPVRRAMRLSPLDALREE